MRKWNLNTRRASGSVCVVRRWRQPQCGHSMPCRGLLSLGWESSMGWFIGLAWCAEAG